MSYVEVWASEEWRGAVVVRRTDRFFVLVEFLETGERRDVSVGSLRVLACHVDECDSPAERVSELDGELVCATCAEIDHDQTGAEEREQGSGGGSPSTGTE